MTVLQPERWASLPGPHDITRTELPNGIVVLTRSNFNSPSVVVSGYLPAGSVFEPDERLGLAYFTSLGLMRGTQVRPFQLIYDALESAGASLGFGASVHNTTFGGRCLAEDLPLLLELLSQALRQAVFPVEQMERLRAQLLTSLQSVRRIQGMWLRWFLTRRFFRDTLMVNPKMVMWKRFGRLHVRKWLSFIKNIMARAV